MSHTSYASVLWQQGLLGPYGPLGPWPSVAAEWLQVAHDSLHAAAALLQCMLAQTSNASGPMIAGLA